MSKFRKYFLCMVDDNENIKHIITPGTSRYHTTYFRPAKYKGHIQPGILMNPSEVKVLLSRVYNYKDLIDKVNKSIRTSYNITNFRIYDIDGNNSTSNILINGNVSSDRYGYYASNIADRYITELLQFFNPTVENFDASKIYHYAKKNPDCHIVFYQSHFSLGFSYGSNSKLDDITKYYEEHVKTDTIIPAKTTHAKFNAIVHSLRVKGIRLPKQTKKSFSNRDYVFEIDSDEAYMEFKLKWDFDFGNFINVSKFKKYI